MFKNIIILNEKPKQPLKSLDSSMLVEEFIEFFQEFIDRGAQLEWAFNANNPDTYDNKYETTFKTFLSMVNKNDIMDEVSFHTVYPTFGVIVAVPNIEKGEVNVSLVYGVEDFWENEICLDCFSSLMGCDEEKEQTEPVVKLISTYPIIQHDQSHDNSFSYQACDCCGSKLGGNRYFLICMKGE